MDFETVLYEGFAPHKVPVIVECLTDNRNRTAPEIRHLFKEGQLGQPGSMSFFFDRLGVVEATHSDAKRDPESDAIEAGAQNLEPLDGEEIPEGHVGTRFLSEVKDLATVSNWLSRPAGKFSPARSATWPRTRWNSEMPTSSRYPRFSMTSMTTMTCTACTLP